MRISTLEEEERHGMHWNRFISKKRFGGNSYYLFLSTTIDSIVCVCVCGCLLAWSVFRLRVKITI